MPSANPITSTILALARPSAFVRRAVKHDVAFEFEKNQELLKVYPDRSLPADRLKNFEDLAWERTHKIREALFVAFFSTVIAVVAGVVAGTTLGAITGTPSNVTVAILQVIGAAIILVATLAFLGWEIQSYKGQTLPEKVNRWLFRAQYWLGTFIFVLSVAWTW
jgi:ABC-type dipeptide/oligopeptide/nickel transport system permease subunit